MALTDRIDTVDVKVERDSGVTPLEGVDAAPWPLESVAVTVNVNRSPLGSPLINARVCLPSTTTTALGGDDVTTYLLIWRPPTLGDAVQFTSAWPSVAEAVTPVGARGRSATMEVGLAGVEAAGSAVRLPATNGNISHEATRPINGSPPLRASMSSMTPVHTGSATAPHPRLIPPKE